MGIKETLLSFMKEEAYRPMDIQELVSVFDISSDEYKVFKKTLKIMELEGSIVRTNKDKFAVPERLGLIKGRIQSHKKGFGFLIPEEDGERDVFIPSSFINGAMNNDRVLVQITRDDVNGKKREGEVIEILERANTKIIGVYEDSRNFGFVVPEDTRLNQDIFISKKDKNGANHGDIVIAEVTKWPDKRRSPEGVIKEVLGKKGEKGLDILTIIKKHGLPEEFPAKVLAYAEGIPEEIDEKEIKRRKDIRNIRMVTKDGEDAKDLDDAVSIEKLENGKYKLGVHIADVSHYVKECSIIDKEAVKRATSVYLVDRTIPMLPERLCNFICSLRPDEEKLAYSVIFNMNEKAEIKDYRIRHTVIKSNRRFTYEEAQNIIETGEGDYKEEILQLNKLAQILREKRMAAGAINFDRCEVKFEIDEKGKPLSVYFKVSKEANKLIEEFMLLANRTVAEHIGKVPKNKKPKVFPYRIHDLPDPDKLDNLSQFIARFGYKIRTGGSKTDVSKSINRLLSDIEGKKEQNLIETVSLRAMQKARYSIYNIGHYGLAFDFYTHFTSPIRRYPDLMVHRLLTRYLAGGRTAQADKYEELCEHSSAMEQTAASAERASIKYKQVEFMSERIGNVYDGVISGVTEWGLYVEVNENKCEGMVSMRDLGNDYYEFDEKNYCLIGRRHHRKFSLGDPVKIKVARANLEKKQLDFILADE